MHLKTVTRPCPLCGEVAYKIRALIERHGREWRLVNCRSCDFEYVQNPRADTSDHQSTSTGRPSVRPRHFQIRNLIEKLGLKNPSSRVVEIGAGNGALALLLAPLVKYVGFEPAANRGSVVIFEEKIEIRPSVFTYTPDLGSINAIILDNVLEHLNDPLAVLKASTYALDKNGYLIVIVPNRYDLRRLIPSWRRKHHYIVPDHINYFSISDLKRIARSLNMKLEFFGTRALDSTSSKMYWLRAFFEMVGISVFGHNVVLRKA